MRKSDKVIFFLRDNLVESLNGTKNSTAKFESDKRVKSKFKLLLSLTRKLTFVFNRVKRKKVE